jgi:hypothetical protein
MKMMNQKLKCISLNSIKSPKKEIHAKKIKRDKVQKIHSDTSLAQAVKPLEDVQGGVQIFWNNYPRNGLILLNNLLVN